MPSSTEHNAAKPAGTSSSEGQSQNKHINREVRDMVSVITSRLTNIHKAGSGQGQGQEEGAEDEDNGVRIITLAGTNAGANFRGEVEDHNKQAGGGGEGEQPGVVGPTEGLKTYVNSNFQAVNNSIMMGGSYKTNDPGVHVEIADFADPKDFKRVGMLANNKGKKKDKGSNSAGKSSSSSSSSESDSSSD